MKTILLKLIPFITIIVLLVCLIGCNNTDQNINDTPLDGTYLLTEELINTLVSYLNDIPFEYDIPETSLAVKLNRIKDGENGFFVEFDQYEYFYACAYFTTDHQSKEETDHCCIKNYKWTGYEKKEDIKEYNKGYKIVVTFQINKASICHDIVNEHSATPAFEHYQIYSPKFENNSNIAPAILFDYSLIYITSSNDDFIYFSADDKNHELNKLSCLELDGETYITTPLYTEYTDGHKFETNLKVEFGDYYNDLLKIMINGKYSKTGSQNEITHYGLFAIDSIKNIIK